MNARAVSTAGSKPLGLWVTILFISLFAQTGSEGAPFTLRGPGVNTNDFRVTTFASNLSFPLGMARLADGSLLVAVNQGSDFFSAPGRIVRLVDADQDGVADGPPALLYSGLPSGQTSLRRGGNLLFVTGQGSEKPIIVLRVGATPDAALSYAGQININYPAWYHPHSALLIHDVPGTTNMFNLFFQLGSQHNYNPTTTNGSITNINITGAIGAILGDSIYRLTIIDRGTSVSASNLTHIARGLRNAAGFAFHPETGDFYFQDNGIDGLINANEPMSADELNVIRASDLGTGPVEYFGFPVNYIEYRTGRNVGGLGIQPLVAFQPLPDPTNGNESEGPNDIVFAPPGFPQGLNNGIFVSFHGKFNGGGLANEENPLVYVDLATTNYFHFIEGHQVDVGHLDGLLATDDSLFVADLTTNGNLGNGSGLGVIYQIKSLVLPPVSVTRSGGQLELTWSFGTLQSAGSVTGPWNDVNNASSPYSVDAGQSPRFFRTRN